MNEAYEYYRTARCQHPNSQNKVMLASLDKVMAFSAFQNMELLFNQPLLMVVGSKSDAMYLTDRAIEKATSAASKEKFVIDGATHVDLYDKQPYNLADRVNRTLQSLPDSQLCNNCISAEKFWMEVFL